MMNGSNGLFRLLKFCTTLPLGWDSLGQQIMDDADIPPRHDN